MYLQQYSLWPLVSVRECSLRVRNAHVSMCCRNLYSYSGKKTTLLPLCACTVLSPERPWSIIWILRNYCHAADYWDNHANSSWELFRSNSVPAALCCCRRGSCSGRGGSFRCWHPAARCKTALLWRVSQGTDSCSKSVLITLLTLVPQSSGLVWLQPLSQRPGFQTWANIPLKLACSLNGCKENSAKHRHSEEDI